VHQKSGDQHAKGRCTSRAHCTPCVVSLPEVMYRPSCICGMLRPLVLGNCLNQLGCCFVRQSRLRTFTLLARDNVFCAILLMRECCYSTQVALQIATELSIHIKSPHADVLTVPEASLFLVEDEKNTHVVRAYQLNDNTTLIIVIYPILIPY